MICLILASGFGTRLYPLNVDRAKGLIEYKGKALISHIVDKIPHNIDILVNINKKYEEDFRRWQGEIGREVVLCIEPVTSPEESYGAVGSLNYWIKEKGIADDLLVIASDNFFEFDLKQFISNYNGINVLVAVHDIGDLNKAGQYGVVQVEGSRIIKFEEKPDHPKSTLIATACYLIPPHIFPVIARYCSTAKRDNLGSFIAYLTDREEVHAYTFRETWIDVGSISTYLSIRESP